MRRGWRYYRLKYHSAVKLSGGEGVPVHTSQVIVGQAGSPCDLRRHSVFLETADVESGRSGDIALAAYVVVRLIDRLLGADIDRSRALDYQVEAARRHVRELRATDSEVARLRRLVDVAAR